MKKSDNHKKMYFLQGHSEGGQELPPQNIFKELFKPKTTLQIVRPISKIYVYPISISLDTPKYPIGGSGATQRMRPGFDDTCELTELWLEANSFCAFKAFLFSVTYRIMENVHRWQNFVAIAAINDS